MSSASTASCRWNWDTCLIRKLRKDFHHREHRGSQRELRRTSSVLLCVLCGKGSYGPSTKPKQMEISPGLLHIPRNLLAQSLDRRKLDLIPQSLQKADLNFGIRRQFERMKIQQMRFDGE